MHLVDVALPIPLAQLFTYELPEPMRAQVAVGARVLCPFGRRKLVGVAVAMREGDGPAGVRPALFVLDDVPALPPKLLEFLRELGAYCMASLGEVVKLALPPEEKASREARATSTNLSLFGANAVKGVAPRQVQWVRATDASEGVSALRPNALALLSYVRSVGEVPVARLRERWSTASNVVSTLARQGLVDVFTRSQADAPYFRDGVARDVAPELTSAQADAVQRIDAALALAAPKTFVLHGVTGSGKTEVYLRAIDTTRGRGRSVIVLVPEIALTPQLVQRYRARFGDDLAVLHSALSDKERYVMWRRLRRGEVHVAIGARSALFAPLSDVGLIVVDEEHDGSFKQDEGVRYHARDMAILRAHREGAVCILGSATPSLESLYLADNGKAERIRLPDRARAKTLPTVEVVDMRRIGPGPTGDKRLSLILHRALEQTLARKEQAILFLNRRGFAPSVRCGGCGHVENCPDCSVALTYHKGARPQLRCHYCDYRRPAGSACSACSADAWMFDGAGTEKLEEVVAAAFPDARVARLDRDVGDGRAAARVIERMRAGEIDVLVGTQMVTKGHDLPLITLVGVINADAALSLPDFRAAERAFQLLVQVAGRAGRADRPGKVIVQTYDPDHAAIRFARAHDTEGFVSAELVARRELGYPPFSRLALLRLDGVEEAEVRTAAAQLASVIRGAHIDRVDVLGPAPAPLARLKGRYRFRVMLRSVDRSALRHALRVADAARGTVGRSIRVVIDVDPVQLL